MFLLFLPVEKPKPFLQNPKFLRQTHAGFLSIAVHIHPMKLTGLVIRMNEDLGPQNASIATQIEFQYCAIQHM